MSLLDQVKERLNTDANRASESRVRDAHRAEAPAAHVVAEWRPPKHPYDPRPDLPDPDNLWRTVLATCYGVWGLCELYTLLQGLRILECRIEWRGDRLHLDYRPALNSWDKAELLDTWLKPNADGIKEAFERSVAVLRGLDAKQRTPSWMRKGA